MTETEGETGHDKLIRAGFLRQTQSGIFHLLPLGVRVQDKLGKVIDKHMESIGASRLAMSSLTTEELWRKSERLEKIASELFRLKDRKDVPLMLAPTHEEEITTLVASTLKSYKDLPIRLYQTTRKYRDEARPRQGLLRSREFIMKDLYSFDISFEDAIAAYQEVSAAYRNIFAELKLPILVAEASSGDMGGDHSHEYHLQTDIGEDTVAHCKSCGYTANDEVAAAHPQTGDIQPVESAGEFLVWRGITKDRKTLVNAWYPAKDGKDHGANLHALKSIVAGLDSGVSDAASAWEAALAAPDVKILNVVDYRLAPSFDNFHPLLRVAPATLADKTTNVLQTSIISSANPIDLLPVTAGDACPRCQDGKLDIHRALELGHTFYLGTRYSEPLEAMTTLPSDPSELIPLQMGCYGIGVSRILAAVAEHKADDKGLNWPRAIAPYEAVVIPTSAITNDIWELYDSLAIDLDVAMDDRKKPFGWKMQDADLTGYPVVVVVGKAWKERKQCEVQCRSLGIKENIPASEVPAFVSSLLEQL